MKKTTSRISVVLFALVVIFFGGRGILQITANSQADKDINTHLLSSTSDAEQDSESPTDDATEPLTLGASQTTLGASQATLGYSATAFGTYGINDSIAGVFPASENAKIVVVPGTGVLPYQSYPSTPAGMADALMNLHTNGENKDYTIHIGTAFTMPLSMGAEVPSANPTTADISFTALKGKVANLTFIANYNDPVGHENITATTTTGTVVFPNDSYFGSNVLMRNISYNSNIFYMMGHSLTLGYGSYFNTGLDFFGGSSATAIIGDPTLTIYSTGAGLQNYYGGGRTPSSTLTGNPSVVVHNTSTTAISTITAGSRDGKLNGDSSLTIHKTSASIITNIYGSGTNGNVIGNASIVIHSTAGPITAIYGSTSSGTVTGNVSTTVHNTGGTIGTFVGGPYYGILNGNVTSIINSMGGTGDTNIYAGGFGSGSGAATINGNVSTTINSIGGAKMVRYYGGTNFGNVSGSVTNVLKGTGRFNENASFYTGGSHSGDIGDMLPPGSTAISTDFDSSQYTFGRALFAGANELSGTIKGNINSKVTASSVDNKGSLATFSGGAGLDSRGGSGHGGNDTYNGKTAAEVLTLFMAQTSSSKHKIYGNINNEITKGIVSWSGDVDRGYTRSAGFSGYVEGNVTTKVGTEGLVTSNQGMVILAAEGIEENAGVTNPVPAGIKSRGERSNYDIVGGGGSPGYMNSIYIKGNTHVEQHFTLARWTYGGSFSGLLDGNSTNVLYKGVVDTFEGTGYNNQQQWGNGFAHVIGGQVDWFLSGGGWNDRNLYGNASVTVEGGTINASMGGTYGESIYHDIHGNTTILVTGGNFEGTTRLGPNGFSGGATNLGTVHGNSKVTLDLRNATVPFKLPGGTSISGGRRFDAGAGSKLGTDASNTIELNIYTKAGSDVLNGASIYGDGSLYPDSTKSGKITVNIDAPDSSVGNFYATQYSNTLANSLLRDVTFNIFNLKSVVGLAGGQKNNTFNNTNASTSVNKVTINVNPTALVGDATKTFAVGADGIVNFTDFNINNSIVEVSGVGGIKNGTSVTTSNHGTDYHKFGNINITNGGGFKIGTSAFVSGGMLTVDGKANITSPSGTGKLIVSDLTIGADDSIFWTRAGGLALETVTGNWFGGSSAYKVITFNPVRANARTVTPYNFSGVSETGTILLGDNEDTSHALNGHAIALPGTRVEFSVVGGTGKISHNVDKVLPTDTPPLNGASNQDKDVQTITGWVNFVDSFNGAQLTFTPDAPTGSWIKGVKITRSDGVETLLPEATHSNPVVWDVPTKGFTYVVEVTYTNLSELTGHSVMLSEAEAAAITTAQNIITYQEVSGRPFLTNTITPALIAEINAPLPEGVKVRSHKVTYTVGTAGNLTTKDYYIGVVPNTAVIEKPGRRAAIDANDATMMLAIANNMTAPNLATNYTHPLVYLPDGTTADPTLDSSTINALNIMTVPTSVNATYSYALTDPTATLSKTVVLLVIPDGKLVLDTVPHLDFGQTQVPGVPTKYWKPTATTLVVEDSRINPYGSKWEVTLRVSDLVAGSETISSSNLLYTNTTAANGPVGVYPLNTVTPVWNSLTNAADTQTMLWAISTTEGFSANINPLLKAGAYKGTATWSLQITPSTP